MLTPTIEFHRGIIEDFILPGLSCLLIDLPSLGEGDVITESEYDRRVALSMVEAASNEVIGAFGYGRYIPQSPDITFTPTFSQVLIKASFTATTGEIGPFTHLIVATGGDTFSARASNAYGRGSSLGRTIGVMSTKRSSIPKGVTYEATVPVRIGVKYFGG